MAVRPSWSRYCFGFVVQPVIPGDINSIDDPLPPVVRNVIAPVLQSYCGASRTKLPIGFGGLGKQGVTSQLPVAVADRPAEVVALTVKLPPPAVVGVPVMRKLLAEPCSPSGRPS